MEKKLNILFLSQVSITSLEDRTIYTDLISEFVDHGHNVTVISSIERRNFRLTSNAEKFELIKIKTPNLQKTTKIEKAIGHIIFDFQLLYTIKKYLSKRKFEICLYFSPPITITRTLSYLKNNYKTFNYLWLKDIFPQNAVDMGFIGKNSWVYWYFRKIEQKYYQLSDTIGVMSPANMDYIISNNIGIIDKNKVEVCSNCIKLIEMETNTLFKKIDGKTKFIYGGNLGIPQAIPFILQILSYYLNRPDVEFIIIGSGTEFQKLNNWVNIKSPKNVKVFQQVPSEEYKQWVSTADIGLIFLNHKFTIPNFPSRLLTYLMSKKPVLCFTDSVTDIGKIAKENYFGDFTNSENIESALKLIDEYILKSKEELNIMGENGYKFLKNNFTSGIAYKKIITSYVNWLHADKNVDSMSKSSIVT